MTSSIGADGQHHADDQAEVGASLPGSHGGHGLLMIACCIPMLVIVVTLLALGVVSAGFLVYAIGCAAMMALMMRGMSHHDRGGS